MPLSMSLRPSQLRAMAVEAAMMLPVAAKLRRRYRSLAPPVAIMAGDQDHMVDTVRHTLRLKRVLPKADLRIEPRTGHMVHHIVPDAVAAVIEEAAERSGTG
jgi:pimeloyl-ACP methyl ester carboxylesterase